MIRTNAPKKSLWAMRKKVNRVTTLQKTNPEQILLKAKEKLASLFAKLHQLLVNAEKRVMKLLKKLAETIRKYWEFLIIPTRILILILQKMREQNCLSCKEN